jgi:predicted RNA-binding protein YlxR (DUF448 family)
VRYAAVDGALVADRAQHLPGRGAYVCPAPACFAAARRRGAFPRALRCAVRVTAAEAAAPAA